MEVKLITSTEEFYSLKDDWEELQEEDPDVTYYSTFKFNKTWWDVYKEDKNKSLFIICVYNNKKIVGIAPFIIEERKKAIFEWKVLKFLGRGDYLGIIINRKQNNELTIIKEIFKTIEELKDKWDRIQLTHIKHNSLLAFYLLKNPEYNQYFKYLIECPCIYFSKYKSFDIYKNTFYSKRVNNLKNRLVKEKGFNLKVINNKDCNVYEIISKIHKKEQKFLAEQRNRKERSSLFDDKYYSKFIKEIYIDNSNVVTFFLEADNGEVIHYVTCYFYKGILHYWNSAFNLIYEKYSSGRIIVPEIIKYIFRNNTADVLEFGAGRYDWKFKYTNDFIYDYQLDMWNLGNKKGRRLYKISKLKNK